MRPAGRVSAAIEVLADMEAHKRPAALALKDWGLSHRFAGSGDRAAIGNLVFDALRQRNSIAWRMGQDSPRALALGALAAGWGLSSAEIAAIADGGPHAPAPLTEAELAGLEGELASDAPAHIGGDFPDWLAPALEEAVGERAAEEGRALAQRAPVDLRVNTLKADRDKVIAALKRFGAEATPHSPLGVRIAHAEGPAKPPHVEAEPGHGKGWYEVQDEGSQLATLLAGARPKQQVLDLCAGSGGKTLALAAQMQNTGQLYAYDADRLRLRPIFERLKRAGVRNIQVLPGGDPEALAPLTEKMDLVLVDAPCTGSGIWRRRPDAKWRLRPQMLETRRAEQAAVLDQAAPLVKPGARLAYVTCSILLQENRDQVAAFRERHPEYKLLAWPKLWTDAVGSEGPPSADGASDTLLMTPLSHGTDGFFVAVMQRLG